MIYGALAKGRPHKMVGATLIEHYDGCGCDLLRSVSYAPWISYNLMDGMLHCDHCDKSEFFPTPSVRGREQGDNYYLDHEAAGDGLNAFKVAHLDCKRVAH